MAAGTAYATALEPSLDNLSYEIFSILETRYLFGYENDSFPPASITLKPAGKVCILSIDTGGTTDGILAAKSLALLESSLCRRSGYPDARIADFFDVAAGSGTGGVLAGLLFTRGKDGRPLLSAAVALRFLAEERRPPRRGMLRWILRRWKAERERRYRQVFSVLTVRDTLKTVLIPCFDLLTRAPFVFSRADAVEMDGFDFRMREVCYATSADPTAVGAVEMRSVDGSTRILAVDGGVAMSNPTAMAITHVLNNKREFPSCRGVEDLLVLSLGNGESDSGACYRHNMTPCAGEFVKFAGDGVSDMVDQAVSMTFGDKIASNYVRIQANGFRRVKTSKRSEAKSAMKMAEEMLEQKNVESVLFQGKRISEKSNAEKLDWFAKELVKEEQRRKFSVFPTVLLKQSSPNTSLSSTVV